MDNRVYGVKGAQPIIPEVPEAASPERELEIRELERDILSVLIQELSFSNDIFIPKDRIEGLDNLIRIETYLDGVRIFTIPRPVNYERNKTYVYYPEGKPTE